MNFFRKFLFSAINEVKIICRKNFNIYYPFLFSENLESFPNIMEEICFLNGDSQKEVEIKKENENEKNILGIIIIIITTIIIINTTIMITTKTTKISTKAISAHK